MRFKRSRVATLLVALPALALGAGACGGDDDSDGAGGDSGTSSGAGEGFTIGWVPPTVAPFEEAMREGIEIQAESAGMDVVVAGGQFDPNVQISAVDSLVQQDVDAILIWPIDEAGIQPAFDRARQEDMPIITIDSPEAGATVDFVTDDFDAARAMAKFAAEQIGEPCRVGIIEGLPVVPILKARNGGYAEGAQEAGCEILDKQVNSDDTPEKAGEIVGTWKTRFGDEMDGVLAINDPSALAARAQVDETFDPVIVGFNGDSPNLEAIESGQIAATGALQSPEIGNGMAYAALQLLNGEQVPQTIESDYFQVDESNIDEYLRYEERLTAPMSVSFDGEGQRAKLVTELGD